MNDMSQVIIPKSDQINADDLIGKTMTVTIRDVKISAGQEQPVAMRLEGTEKVYRPCKIMSRLMVPMWGPDASKYSGKSMTLYRDPNVKWGALTVGGIRISHMSHIDGEQVVVLQEKRGALKPHVIKPLKAEVVQHPANERTEKSKITPEQWTERTIAALEQAGSMDALMTIVQGAQKAADKLAESAPELFERLMAAQRAAEQRLSAPASDDADPFSND